MCKVAPRVGEGAAPGSVEHSPEVAKNGGEVTLKRELGLFSAINVVLNCMIGKYLLTFHNFFMKQYFVYKMAWYFALSLI